MYASEWQHPCVWLSPPQEYLPVIHILCNPGLRPRHWKKLCVLTGLSITPDSGISLRKMLKFNLEPYLEDMEAVSAGASKEFSLEKAMQKMEDDWDPIVFNTVVYRCVWRGMTSWNVLYLENHVYCEDKH